MIPIDVHKRTLGVNFSAVGAEVKAWAPLAENVAIFLPQKGKKIALSRQDLGFWGLVTKDIKPDDLYQFELDGRSPLPDPASLSQPGGVHGPSQAIDIKNFEWNDSLWHNHPLQDYLIYELHTGTFSPEGTFADAGHKLAHLKELGITAVEIMPVAQFPGNRNWGYDGVYPFAVQDSYGGARGLKSFVDACHREGLAVILDVVYNHLGPEGNYFNEYGPYFTQKYTTPWGGAVNFDDAYCDGVRHYFIENVLMWFRDFHIDALRMDAVHAIKDFSPVHILKEIKQHVDLLMLHTGRLHYLIAELDLNDNRYIDPISKGGYGIDAQWIDEFHHALRSAATGEKTGYYSDFQGIAHLAKAYRDAYVFDGQYSEHRKKFFGIKADRNPGQQFVVFSQNHDQVGNRMLGERSSRLVSFEMQKLMAGAVLASPFLPMLFMGEEWSEPNPFLYFVSHTDPDLVEAVRKGRKEEFADFHAQGEAPDPQAESTFNQSKLQWDLIGKEPHQTMVRYYKELISIRKKITALSLPDRNSIETQHDEAKKTLILYRWHKEQYICCLMNFSTIGQQVAMPSRSSKWQKLLASSDKQWDGPLLMPDIIGAFETLIVPPESFTLYINSHV